MKLFKKYSFRTGLPRSLNPRASDQSGQAMIEYILVVIISVTMLFLAKGVFSNMNDYISGYVGGYFKCLMTQGELPALGVSDSDLSKHTSAGYKCTASLKKTDPSNLDSGGGNKNVGTTTSISSTKKPQGSTVASASSRAGSSNSNSSSKKDGANRRRLNNNDSSDGDDSTRFSSNIRNRSEAYSSSDGEGDDSVRSVPMSTRNLADEKSTGYRAVSGEESDQIKKKTRGGGILRRENLPRKLSSSSADDDTRPGPRQSKFGPHTRAVAAVADEAETEMGFGYFMKWIMIAGIGIVIFIFFGGQIMNYNNSDG